MIFSPLLGSLTVLGVIGTQQQVYLFRDEFATPQAAPLTTPRTCEPGPGVGIVSSPLTYISGGNIVLDSDATYISQQSYSATPGLMILAEYVSSGPYRCGFGPGGLQQVYEDGGIRVHPSGIFIAISYNIGKLKIIRRSAGSFYVDGANKLIYVSNSGSSALTIFVQNRIGASTLFGSLRVCQLAAPWDIDYGIATNRIISPTSGDTTTSEADAVTEMTWTAATGQVWELSVRRTDDNNLWIVRCDQAGGFVKLIERNAGVETERSSAAQTWSNGIAYRLVIVQDGNTIRTYINNVAKNSYTSAAFNVIATGVKTDRAGSNLITWPRTLSGAALAELNRYSA